MKVLLVMMTGIGFTLGVVFGLLLHLPTDSLPAQQQRQEQRIDHNDIRNRRFAESGDVDILTGSYEIRKHAQHPTKHLNDVADEGIVSVRRSVISDRNLRRARRPGRNSHANELLKNGKVNFGGGGGDGEKGRFRKGGHRSLGPTKQNVRVKLGRSLSKDSGILGDEENTNPVFSRGLNPERKTGSNRLKYVVTDSATVDRSSSSVFLGDVTEEGLKRSNNDLEVESVNSINNDEQTKKASPSLEDQLYLSSVVDGVYWTRKSEQACRKPFSSDDTDTWRTKVQGLDVVKMETGCGRMQNRLLTFRDASKACARYRLNTDQIQGDIFSYYLSKLLNIPNLPPTVLAAVDSVDKKWRTVHLDLSLAQWADSKVVVLTKYIEGLQPAHIPNEFRDEHRKLHPVLAHLGDKSRPELCELIQWSDLIVFDYLTANLDRVINNMFNSQWNDQMMASPTHNLEKFTDGGLVFLDNESGLFHGYRLIEKYEKLHRTLLDSLCVFRSSTADVIKRLATSGSVGKELRALLESNEPLARNVPTMPSKNVKILEGRLQQVYQQIIQCEKDFGR